MPGVGPVGERAESPRSPAHLDPRLVHPASIAGSVRACALGSVGGRLVRCAQRTPRNPAARGPSGPLCAQTAGFRSEGAVWSVVRADGRIPSEGPSGPLCAQGGPLTTSGARSPDALPAVMSDHPVPEMIAPGQESVWDYPRPPALRASEELIMVILGGEEICETRTSWRILETSHPPTYYLPRSAFVAGALRAGGRSLVLRVEGRRLVPGRARWGQGRASGGLVLPAAVRPLRRAPRPRRDLCRRDGPLPGRRRGGRCRRRAASTAAGSPQR